MSVVAENRGRVRQPRHANIHEIAADSIIKTQVECRAFQHPAASANNAHREVIRFAGRECRVELVGYASPIRRVVILKQSDLGHSEQPDRLIAVAVINVIGAVRGGVLECARELHPREAPVFLIPIRFGRLLPRINVDGYESGRRRFERIIGHRDGSSTRRQRQRDKNSDDNANESSAHVLNLRRRTLARHCRRERTATSLHAREPLRIRPSRAPSDPTHWVREQH